MYYLYDSQGNNMVYDEFKYNKLSNWHPILTVTLKYYIQRNAYFFLQLHPKYTTCAYYESHNVTISKYKPLEMAKTNKY